MYYHPIYSFGQDYCDWEAPSEEVSQAEPAVQKYEAKRILGGKGAALVDMSQMGLPVPPGFTITTEMCNKWRKLSYGMEPGYYSSEQEEFLETLLGQTLSRYESMAAQFSQPPLVSVRSGAPISMPGMMDTILNVGLTSKNLHEWKHLIGERAALDSYRRLIQMMGETAFGIDAKVFSEALQKTKNHSGVELDSELSIDDLLALIEDYKFHFKHEYGHEFPDTVQEQLRAAIVAVFDSWDNPRAIHYREMNNIDDAMGTAVTVQAMVFGNMGETSGSGVLFTRNPSTGDDVIMAEYLPNAQGEDVVAGTRTPESLLLEKDDYGEAGDWRDELIVVCSRLEEAYRDMVDVEFTVQEDKLYILQSRAGKRSARAAFKINLDLVEAGVIDVDTAVSRITVDQYKVARRPGIDPHFDTPHHMQGLPACPGVVTGKPVFSSDDAVNCTEPCILVTHETTPDDIKGMHSAVGILTQTGGATSHAAVVARAMDKPCITGCTDLEIQGNLIGMNGAVFAKSGADNFQITIDGSTGRVWVGIDVPLVDSSDSPELKTFMDWCMELGDYCETTIMNPDDPDKPAHICVSEWWGDLDVLGIVLDELSELTSREHIRLDLRKPVNLVPKEDHSLMDCFTGPPEAIDDFLSAALKRLVERVDLGGLGLVLDKWSVDKTDISMLKQRGYRLSESPKTVADLLGSVTVDPSPEFIDNVIGGDEAWQKLKKVLKQSGFEMRAPKQAVPPEYAVFKQLKKA